MEFEFWWLLALPVFFGMGWVAARVDLKSLLSDLDDAARAIVPPKRIVML